MPLDGIFIPGFLNIGLEGVTEPFGYVLDQLSSYPAVAYSVRQLTANPLYVRPYCMLVRRDSDNATLNIGYVNGLLDIVSLLAFCGSGNGYVVTWYNQGSLGSSADATQATAASQPQIVASGVVETQNGVPSVYFGGSQWLNTPSVQLVNAANGNWGAFAVAQFTGTSANAILAGQRAPASYAIFFEANYLSGQSRWQSDAANSSNALLGTSNSAYLTQPTGLQVIRSSASGTATNIVVNGASGTPVTYSASLTTSPFIFTIGAFYYTSGANPYFGYASEIGLVPAVPSASDGMIYDLNAASFFGITGVTQ